MSSIWMINQFMCIFPGECDSQTAVEESELTQCVEDVYKVRTQGLYRHVKVGM